MLSKNSGGTSQWIDGKILNHITNIGGMREREREGQDIEVIIA
jgi:hypothetical protein